MSNNANQEIWVKILRAGFIPQLGIQGPIPNPIKITREKAHNMIVAGIDVYQVDEKTRETTKLTLHTVLGGEAPKAEVKPEVKTPVPAPVKAEKPVELTGVKVEESKKEEAPKAEEKKEEVKAEAAAPVVEKKEEVKEDASKNINKNNNNKKH